MSFLNPGVRMMIISLFLFFGVFAPSVMANFGMCQPGWEWANNTLQQNPCEIASALDSQCGGTDGSVLGPLKQGTNYVTPQRNDTAGQKCNCNTVVFSLFMACTACQNVTTQSWVFWSQYCDQVYVTQYPGTIPPNTAVPHWAFLNYTVGNEFDPVAAKAVGDLPEAFGPVPSSVSLATPSPSTTVNPTGQDRMEKSLRIGAIVGGVMGGLAVLLAIGFGVCIFFRKRASAWGDQEYSDDIEVSTGAPMSAHGITPFQIQPYDPSDPSTYPTHVDDPQSGQYTTAFHKGRYTGAAEL